MTGSVDIIIPTFGRPQDVSRLVASLQPLCGQRDSIIVVDQGTTGPHPNLPAPVKRLQLPKPNLPAARNAGVRSSNADIVLFLDDDVVPLPGLVDGHRSCYADQTIAGVTGFIDDPLFDRTQALPSRIDLSTGNCVQNFAHSKSGRTISAMGANMSFKRSALLSIGGFDECYRSNALWEDIDCSLRMIGCGHRLYYCANAKVRHLRRLHGGCRKDTGRRYLFHQFANTAYFAIRFAQPRHYGSWLRYWMYRLEYLSRNPASAAGTTSRDPFAVISGAAGAMAGTTRYLCGLISPRHRVVSPKAITVQKFIEEILRAGFP
jgi:GT2 family glycosyltransferase